MTADGQIKSFFQRWENLEAEKKQVADLMKDLFIEAKSLGYQPKAMRAAFRLKTKQDLDSPADAEFEAVVDIYLDALNSSARNARLRTRENIEEFDPITGEFLEDEQPETATRPGQDVQSPSQRAMAGENLDVTGGESAAGSEGSRQSALASELAGRGNASDKESVTVVGTESGTVSISPSDDDAIAAVNRNAGLANVTDVEPSSSAPIATASQGEAEAPSVERVSPSTDEGSADANTGGDHEVADPHSFAAQAGAPFSKTAPAKLLRPHCRNPQMCGSGTIDHCHSCKVAMREREVA